MNKYELMLILNSSISEEDRKRAERSAKTE